MVTRKLPRALLGFVGLVTAGMVLLQGRAEAQQPDGAQESREYRIGPEDLLDISVWNNTAISRTVPVRPDGKISLPLLDDVQAAGLTSMELRDVLARKLEDYIPTPEVSVIVREVHSFKVSVIGEVKRPGRYELKSGATVLDLLAMAEGLSEFAARGRIVILRHDGTTVKRIPFNYNRVVSGNGDLGRFFRIPFSNNEVVSGDGGVGNFFLQPGDIILVP